MKSIRFLALAALPAGLLWGQPTIPGMASNGAELFKSQKCIDCHSVGGEGAKVGPDLSQRSSRAYTPALMAAQIWNHAPAMWSAMERANIKQPELTDRQAGDMFAYFYAFRYFEAPGDAARGRKVFDTKGCNQCHSVDGEPSKRPVTQWKSAADPVALAGELWNHSPRMYAEVQAKKLTWPVLTGQDLTDLIVFAQNVPGAIKVAPTFTAAAPDTGERLFKLNGCQDCHTGANSLQGAFRSRTMADFAAAMWNHAPKMLQMPTALRPEEMTRLVGYLWSVQYFDGPGNAVNGKKVFEKKRCASCHGGSGTGPNLAGRKTPLNAVGMVSVTWKHGPEMYAGMRAKKVEWPKFRDKEMNDLIAYVNTLQ